MSLFDKLEFAARQSLWDRFQPDQLQRFFDIRNRVFSCSDDLDMPLDPETTHGLLRKNKRILDDYEMLSSQGFSWSEKDENVLLEGDQNFKLPPDIAILAEELINTKGLSDEDRTSRAKARKIGRHLKEREEYLMDFPHVRREDLTPEHQMDLSYDPLSKEAPDCVYGLRIWHLEQFYDVKEINDGVFSASRLAGNFTLFESKNDQQAITWIRAGLAIQNFGFQGAFRGPNGNMMIAVRKIMGKPLHFWTAGGNTSILPRWYWGKLYVHLCGLADYMWSLGLRFDLTRFNTSIAYNGDLYFTELNTVDKPSNNHDGTMIRSLGRLFHWLYCGSEVRIEKSYGGTVELVKFGRKEIPKDALAFLQRSTYLSDEFLLKHPISENTFVKFYMQRGEFQSPSQNLQEGLRRPELKTEKKYLTGVIFVKLPHIDTKKYTPPDVKSTLLIDAILKYMGRCDRTNTANPLDVMFEGRNGVGTPVSDSHLIEAWKSFFEQHSLWTSGPYGFYMTDGKQPCYGCKSAACMFREYEYCIDIGKWIANTLLRPSGIPIPLPLDPVFLQVLTKTTQFFEGVDPDSAAIEYERIIEGREIQLSKVQKGLFTAEELEHDLKNVPISLIMSWLFRPTPIDRATLMKNITVTQTGGNQECLTWFMDWFYACSEMDLRWFLTETLGSPVPSPPIGMDVIITQYTKRDSTEADVCGRDFTIPATKDRELFYAMLTFGQPFFFNK